MISSGAAYKNISQKRDTVWCVTSNNERATFRMGERDLRVDRKRHRATEIEIKIDKQRDEREEKRNRDKDLQENMETE